MKKVKGYKQFLNEGVNTSNVEKYHRQFAINKDNLLGRCYLWGWKGVFNFGSENYTKTGFIEYPLDAFETGELKQITRQEFDDIYKERNITSGEPGSRTHSYGHIHDDIMEAVFEDPGKQSYWSKDFCVSYASMCVNDEMLKDFRETFNTTDREELKRFPKEEIKKIFLKYHLSDGCTYEKVLDSIMDGNISVEDAKDKVEYFKKNMPAEYWTLIGEEINSMLKK